MPHSPEPETIEVQTAEAVDPAAICSELDDYATDDLLERLPSHFHLARNGIAPEHDRWRLYNCASGEYIAPGYSTAREALIFIIRRQEAKGHRG
jgi:hypothetical protein